MKPHQEQALLSLSDLLEEGANFIEVLAREGRLGNEPPRYTPLTPVQQEALGEALARFREALARFREAVAPERNFSDLAPPSATRFQIEARLEEMADLLREVEPERFTRRYGPLSGEEVRLLDGHLRRLRQTMALLRWALEAR